MKHGMTWKPSSAKLHQPSSVAGDAVPYRAGADGTDGRCVRSAAKSASEFESVMSMVPDITVDVGDSTRQEARRRRLWGLSQSEGAQERVLSVDGSLSGL